MCLGVEMSFAGVLLCVTAALAWGGLDVCRKWLGERGDPKSIAAWLALFQVPGFALWWSVQGHVDLLAYAGVGLGLILISDTAQEFIRSHTDLIQLAEEIEG